jgi:hypothetical protein
MSDEYNKIVNQFIEILLYDIDIKFYELKKNKIDINTADKIFDDYYKIKINEFNNKLIMARKIYK